MADVRTPELVINKLTKQQYENIQNPSATEIYLVPEDEEHKPICYPTTASDIGTTSMLVKSSVSDNGKMLTENGFVYNTSGNPTVSDTKVVCDLGVGLMEKKLENLTTNTQYHIRSYGENASGLVYGSELVQRTYYNPIPDEYQLVEYLENNGSEYINTLFAPSFLTTYNIKFVIVTGSPHFYSRTQSTVNDFGLMDIINGCRMGYKTNYDTLPRISGLYSTRINTTTNKYELYINDSINLSVNLVAFDTSNQLTLFAANRESLVIQSAKSRVEYLQIYDNGTLVRDMYPVYRIADNKPGMYDIVNNVFYTNQGTGEFGVGPDKEFEE